MKNILILHIPKTGGNSIQNFFSKLENFKSYSIGHDINNCKKGGSIKLFKNGKFCKIDVINNFKVLLNIQIKLMKKSKLKNNYVVKDKKKFDEFLKNGAISLKINNNLLEKLKKHLKNDILELKSMEKPKMEIYQRGYLLERTKLINNDCLKIIDEIANDLKLYSFMRKYYNCNFKLSSAKLHRSTEEDEHPIQTLNDLIKNNPPRHKNLHIDPKLDIKCIIYLNEISKDSGPFSYIKGSHLFSKTSICEKNFAKAINVFNINNTPQKRFEFLSLPRDLQKSASFGNYILNESKNGKYIRDNLFPFLSDSGNLIFFDPDGIHLGGNCYNNCERIAIQVIFKPII